MARLFLTLLIFVVFAGCSQKRISQQGAQIFAENCVVCHGADLKGGGGAGVVGLGEIPSDLTILTTQSGGVFPADVVLLALDNYATGRQPGRQMRAFAGLQSERRTRVRTPSGRQKVPEPQAALLAYIKAQQQP